MLLALTLVTYVVFYTIPVHPGCLVVQCGGPGTSTPAQLKAADHLIGADRPVVVQYGDFVWQFVRHGTLGRTFQGDVPVTTLLKESLPVTASLVLGGAVLLLLIALPLAVIAALRPRSLLDRGILVISLFGIAFHPFVVGLILRNVFATRLGFVPDAGYCPLRGGDGCSGVRPWASHLLLPWLTFALFFLPFYVRILRSRIIEAIGEPHVLVARAKGASEARIIRSHLLRGALPPVVAMLAMDIGGAVTAAIYIETIFAMNGVGLLALGTLSGNAGGYDLPTVVGIVVTVAAAIVVLNLFADIVSAALDPRIRLREGSGLIRLPGPLQGVGRLFPLPVRVAIGGAAVAGVVLLYAETGNHARAAVHVPQEPRKTIRLGWNERAVVGPSLRFRVDSVAIGKRTWAVRASVRNSSAEALSLVPGRNTSQFDMGPGLVVPVVVETDFRAQFQVVPAVEYSPPLPEKLEPGQSWSGTFAGVGKLPRKTLINVGFGIFQLPGGHGSSSWTSQNTFRLS